MLEIKRAIGPGNWVSKGDVVERRDAMQDLFFDFAVRPEELDEDWPEDRQLYAEMVLVDGDRLVGTAMLVVDPEREDRPARIWGMGLLEGYRTDFVIQTLEEALIRDAYLDAAYPFVEATDGTLIPNPYSEFEGLLAGQGPMAA